jgi:hypothetical protein
MRYILVLIRRKRYQYIDTAITLMLALNDQLPFICIKKLYTLFQDLTRKKIPQ